MRKFIRAFCILAITGSVFICLLCAPNCFSQEQLSPGIVQPGQPDQGAIQGKPGDKKISLDIKGMEITDVLKMLALRSGMNIVAGKNVRGKVTIFLKDVDMMDAIEIILISNELAYDMQGSIINVMTDRDYEALYGERFQDKKALKIIKLKYGKASEVSKALNQIKSRVGKVVIDEISNTIAVMDSPQIISDMEQMIKEMDLPVATKMYALNYSKAETIKTKLEPLLTKGIGTIQLDERTNKVIVTDLTSNMAVIDTSVREFDEKTKEVLIDSKILQITLNSQYQAGINWDAIFAGIKSQVGMNFNVISGSPIPTSAPGAATGGGVHIGGLDTRYGAEAMIKLLQTYGKTNLLASPRIVTINNEEAKILVGTNQPYATSQTTTPGTGASTTAYQITFLDLGVKLYVTPTINRDDYITMRIKPEVSSTSSDYKYGANQDTVPIVKTSHAETTVMVKNGTTIVIAGLIENRQEESVNKVPGLGDAPFIGSLFRSRTLGSSTNPEKNELVIFLTPHIISGDVVSPEVEKYGGLTKKLEKQLTQAEIKDFEDEVENNEVNEDTNNDSAAAAINDKKTVTGENYLKGETAQQGEPVFKKITPKQKQQISMAQPETGQKARPQPKSKPADQARAPANRSAQPQAQLRTKVKGTGTDDYYEIIRQKIIDKVKLNLPQQPVKGEVDLMFTVQHDGTLKNIPSLLRPADKVLLEAALKAVKAAEPFPPFPADFREQERKFKISITYE